MSQPGNKLAAVQLIVAIATSGLAYWLSPKITTGTHKDYVDFFAAVASVIAALLIALAIESRQVVRSVFLASLSALVVAVGLSSAVAALGPDFSARTYRVLFALAVGGGAGALVAALVLGAQTMQADVEQARLAGIEGLFRRSLEDKQDSAPGA